MEIFDVADMVERCVGNVGIAGSNPTKGRNNFYLIFNYCPQRHKMSMYLINLRKENTIGF